ncbi:MAG: carbamoyl-phosphate synthase large subunit, partial [Nitrososphaerales archaeon]
ELLNEVTGKTTACFEPSMDYLVVKMPRWDLTKFERVNRGIGTQMKSVGEVMGVGRSFEEALQKGIRLLEIGKNGLVANNDSQQESLGSEQIEGSLVHPTDEILFRVADAIKSGMDMQRLSSLSEIDPWFIQKMMNIVSMEGTLRGIGPKVSSNHDVLRVAKKYGFSDKQVSKICRLEEDEVRTSREKLGIFPVAKQIDTLAAEWPSQTNYLYATYGGNTDDLDYSTRDDGKVVVLGAGTYRIGSSVEFDWGTMNMIWALKKLGAKKVITINCNPETVSTDYDMSDRLYFEELSVERVLDICSKEGASGVVACVGGQTANNLIPKLAKKGVRLLGTSSEDVDKAENRSKFGALLEKIGVPQPSWSTFSSIEDAEKFAISVGYPILVRPSYVLSGAAMRVVWSISDLEKFLLKASQVSPEHPVVISKFIQDAKEVEVDAVSDAENVYIGAIIEHIEKAGIHSGDAIMVIPPQSLSQSTKKKLVDYTEKISRALRIKGPLNIQYLVKDDDVYVIECNARASRSMPFVSKSTDTNLMELAARAVLGKEIPSSKLDFLKMKTVAVKVPQFSFTQLEGADTLLGVEMQSTGEVACLGVNFFDALCKALAAGGYRIPGSKSNPNALITIGGPTLKERIIPLVSQLNELGYHIFATDHTAKFLNQRGIAADTLHKIGEAQEPNIAEYLARGSLDLIINIPGKVDDSDYSEILNDEYSIRRKGVELGVPVITNFEAADVFVKALSWTRNNNLTLI